ncbi:MAG: peptidylprolyl isomerase [Acidobacteria bacterium]|nr:peptidylprolyl isomerase [Acidobacteriota bacterium]
MKAMLMRVLFSMMFTTLAAAQGFSQNAVPKPTPQQKTNVRPAAEAPAEPFDKADTATMASKCVQLDTEAGLIEIGLFPESAPESVRNFLNLTALGLFDTTTFSRVVPDFVIQGGNLWTRDAGIEKYGKRANRKVPDEPSNIKHERGIVSLARSDEPNSATANFFILVEAAPHLDGTFAAFGRVTKGMDVVDAINKAPVTGETPDKPVRIKKASVIECQ